MIETGDTLKKRRRWPWVALAFVLCLVGGPLAWQLRPLNATERALVGTWDCDKRTMDEGTLTFTSNRRYTQQMGRLVIPGSWRVVDGALVLRSDPVPPPTTVWSRLLSRLSPFVERWHGQLRIRFDGPDRFEYDRQFSPGQWGVQAWSRRPSATGGR